MNQGLDFQRFSNIYRVKKLQESDIECIYALCKENQIYYQHCPPYVTRASIKDDMVALPPHKTYKDKYYLGYYDQDKLVVVMDFIDHYPNEKTAFIGFFMLDRLYQKKELQVK